MYITTNNQLYFCLTKSTKPLAYLDRLTERCPGFGWDRVHCLPNAWCSAVLQIQYERWQHTDVLVLLSSAYTKSRTLQCLMLYWGAGAQEPRGSTARRSDLKWTKEYSTPQDECPVYKLRAVDSGTAWASVRKRGTDVLCITCFSWVLFLFFISSIISILYFISVIKPTSCTLFQLSPDSTKGKGTSGALYLPTNQAKLKSQQKSVIYMEP